MGRGYGLAIPYLRLLQSNIFILFFLFIETSQGGTSGGCLCVCGGGGGGWRGQKGGSGGEVEGRRSSSVLKNITLFSFIAVFK